ncbi:TPA: hypothetical protein HA265_05230 [Candidatus Woesearchaeota archaeon]|nr:hypothetical protein [Candidatus Woesearchaeota archaeon]
METICIKIDEGMLKKMDQAIKKHNYGTRTEFVREAIRKELKEMTREELIQEFIKTGGISKTKTTEKEYCEIRDKTIKEMAKERGWE